MNKFVPDLEMWYRYALLTVELDCFVDSEILRRKIKAMPQNQESLQPVLDICRAKHDYWFALLGDQDQDAALSFEEGVLNRQNAILALLNMPPLKTISNRMIEARLAG